MIVITGAGGFIGSQLAKALNQLGTDELILIDDFTHVNKQKKIEVASELTTFI